MILALPDEITLQDEASVNAARDAYPARHVGTADEIAAAGVFLLSEEAGFITGTNPVNHAAGDFKPRSVPHTSIILHFKIITARY